MMGVFTSWWMKYDTPSRTETLAMAMVHHLDLRPLTLNWRLDRLSGLRTTNPQFCMEVMRKVICIHDSPDT